MQTAVTEAKKQVEQDKKDIDDTIQNSLLASAEKILESVQDYFNRAEALYSSMYLDCDGETPYLRTVTPIFIPPVQIAFRNSFRPHRRFQSQSVSGSAGPAASA